MNDSKLETLFGKMNSFRRKVINLNTNIILYVRNGTPRLLTPLKFSLFRIKFRIRHTNDDEHVGIRTIVLSMKTKKDDILPLLSQMY